MEWFRQNSQHVINSIRAIVLALTGFGIVQLTTEQLALAIAALESVFGTITAKTTISTRNVDSIVDKRVNDLVSTPAEHVAAIKIKNGNG